MIGPADHWAMPVMVAGVIAMSAAQMFDLATFVAMVDRLGPAAIAMTPATMTGMAQ